MPRNVGTIDQVVRFMIGLALIAYVSKDGIIMPGWIPAVVAGAVLLLTSIFEYCPLYSLLGVSTVGRLDRSV